jgi:hypothetical protein
MGPTRTRHIALPYSNSRPQRADSDLFLVRIDLYRHRLRTLAEELEPSSILAYSPQFDHFRQCYLHPVRVSTTLFHTIASLRLHKSSGK